MQSFLFEKFDLNLYIVKSSLLIKIGFFIRLHLEILIMDLTVFIGSIGSMHISVISINLVVAYYLCGVLIGCVTSGIFVIDHPANTRRRFDIEFRYSSFRHRIDIWSGRRSTIYRRSIDVVNLTSDLTSYRRGQIDLVSTFNRRRARCN